MMRFLAFVAGLTALVLPVRAQAPADPPRPYVPRAEVWVAQAGYGSSRAWNFIGLSYDVVQTEHASLYAAAGFGTILVGVGAAYYTQRQGNGLVLSATAGIAGAHASASYQMRLVPGGYLGAGVSVGNYFLQHEGLMAIVGYEHRF